MSSTTEVSYQLQNVLNYISLQKYNEDDLFSDLFERKKTKYIYVMIIINSDINSISKARCTLCIFDSRFINLTNISASILFAYSSGGVLVKSDKNDSSNKSLLNDNQINIYCVLCHQKFTINLKSINLGDFNRHLNNKHYLLANMINNTYSSFGNMCMDRKPDQYIVNMNNDAKTANKNILSYWRKRESNQEDNGNREIKKSDIEESSDVEEDDIEERNSDDGDRVVTTIDEVDQKITVVILPQDRDIMRQVLCTRLFNLTLTFGDNTKYQSFIKRTCTFGIPCRKTIIKYVKDMNNIVKNCIINYLRDIDGYSYACDGWGAKKSHISLEAEFICIFNKNEYQSFLLSCNHLERSTAENLLENHKITCEEFHKDWSRYITCDGARNNNKAYENQKMPCNAHAIDLIIKHFSDTNNNPYHFNPAGVNLIKKFYDFMDKVSNSLQYQAGSKFQIWVKQFSSLNIDFEDVVSLPEVVSPTRWMGIATKLKWFQTYGILHWRYVTFMEMEMGKEKEDEDENNEDEKKSNKKQKKHDWDYYHDFLNEVHEVLYIIMILERAINILSYSNKPTLHLVIPIRIAMLNLIREYLPNTDIALLLKSAVIFELTEGCLKINEEDDYTKRCMIATALFPEARQILPEMLYQNYRVIAGNEYKKYKSDCKEKGKYTDKELHQNCNNLSEVMLRMKNTDYIRLDDNYLYTYLKPQFSDYYVNDLNELEKLYTNLNHIIFQKKKTTLRKCLNKVETMNKHLPSNDLIDKVSNSQRKTIYKTINYR